MLLSQLVRWNLSPPDTKNSPFPTAFIFILISGDFFDG